MQLQQAEAATPRASLAALGAAVSDDDEVELSIDSGAEDSDSDGDEQQGAAELNSPEVRTLHCT